MHAERVLHFLGFATLHDEKSGIVPLFLSLSQSFRIMIFDPAVHRFASAEGVSVDAHSDVAILRRSRVDLDTRQVFAYAGIVESELFCIIECVAVGGK